MDELISCAYLLSFAGFLFYKLIVSKIPNWFGTPGGGGGPLLAASGMAGNALKSGKGPPAPGCPEKNENYHLLIQEC